MSKREGSRKQYKTKAQIEVDLLKQQTERIPGCIPVKISNYEYLEEEIKFFGVETKNGMPTGEGVSSYQKEFKQSEGLIAWFNIKDLIENDQYTEQVEEIVIKGEQAEIGREEIEIPPAVYLG